MATSAPMIETSMQHLAPIFAPATLTLGLSPIVINLLVGGFLLVSIAMILLVLIQRPQGGGLSGAFGAGGGGGGGGGGAGQTAFGTKTGDVLTGATIAIFICFLLFAIGLNFAARPADPDERAPAASAPAGTAPGAAPDEDVADEETGDGSGEPAELVDPAEAAPPVSDPVGDAPDEPTEENPPAGND